MGLQPVTGLWSEAWRALCLAGWKWARHDLQLKDAAHPDLPRIIRRISELQR